MVTYEVDDEVIEVVKQNYNRVTEMLAHYKSILQNITYFKHNAISEKDLLDMIFYHKKCLLDLCEQHPVAGKHLERLLLGSFTETKDYDFGIDFLFKTNVE